MMINIGDKLTVVKKVASFLDKGDIVKVVDIDEYGMISFAFGEDFMHKGLMNITECEEHFERAKEERPAPSITLEHIEEILADSEITAETMFDKCTIVSCKLPNGFVIVESSACVSPENYDENMGFDICMKKITDKIWELEGYRLQEELYRESVEAEECHIEESSCDCCDCEYCGDDDCPGCEYSVVFGDDECLDTDLDCDDCEDCNCPYNPNN